MKTPPNNFGSTGNNAKKYDLYIQDEALYVFQDKYGKERGTRSWENIIGVGNAMWKACDEILGERRTMEAELIEWFNTHKDIYNQCQDANNWLDKSFYKGSYIVDWTWWILTQIIDGKKFTQAFLYTCIPTFKGVEKIAPITTKVLLQYANIDVENFSELKNNVKKDTEKTIANDTKKTIKNDTKKQNNKDLIQTLESLNISDKEKEQIINSFENKFYDKSIDINDLITLPAPTNKDEQRIYDMVIKSNINKQPSIIGLNVYKIMSLTDVMNKAIKDDEKRKARAAAATKYGILGIANIFK